MCSLKKFLIGLRLAATICIAAVGIQISVAVLGCRVWAVYFRERPDRYESALRKLGLACSFLQPSAISNLKSFGATCSNRRRTIDVSLCLYKQSPYTLFGRKPANPFAERSSAKSPCWRDGNVSILQGEFLQALEGEADAVLATFSRISDDSGHRHVVTLRRGAVVGDRVFNIGRWASRKYQTSRSRGRRLYQ